MKTIPGIRKIMILRTTGSYNGAEHQKFIRLLLLQELCKTMSEVCARLHRATFNNYLN